MPTTARGLRYPSLPNTANVPRDIGYLAADVDAQLAAIPVVKSNSSVGTTNGFGELTINYGYTFTALSSIVVTSGDAVSTGCVSMAVQLQNTGGFVIRAYNAAGSLLTSTAVRCNWVAVGTGV